MTRRLHYSFNGFGLGLLTRAILYFLQLNNVVGFINKYIGNKYVLTGLFAVVAIILIKLTIEKVSNVILSIICGVGAYVLGITLFFKLETLKDWFFCGFFVVLFIVENIIYYTGLREQVFIEDFYDDE